MQYKFNMIVALLFAKLAAFLLRLLHRGGTTLPGKIALKLSPHILTKLSKNVTAVCVSGTNGKTTVCALLSHALQQENASYFTNNSGANMLTGVVTAFLQHCSITGKCQKQIAVLECDENSLPAITAQLQAEVIVVTNLFRDQLDRYGEVAHTLAKIKEGIAGAPQAVLVLNADCPLTVTISESFPNQTVTFGVQDNSAVSAAISDNRRCPHCGAALRYRTRIYAQLGDFYCPQCDFCHYTADYTAQDVAVSELSTGFLLNTPNGVSLCTTALGGIYNVYNFVTAAAVLGVLGRENTRALCTFSGAFGRMERFHNGSQTILLLLVKNPVGLTGCIRTICTVRGALGMCFALNDNEADGCDVSWIWDCDFTPLRMKNPPVYTAGTRASDMALRLQYDGIDTVDIIENEDYDRLLDIIAEAGTDFAVFASYTAMMHLRRRMIARFGGREFWE